MKEKISIPQEEYDRDYLLSDFLEGYEFFKEGKLSSVKEKQLGMLELDKNHDFLDIGFGRGELLMHCARECNFAEGIDYSESAYEIGKEYLKNQKNARVQIADCRELPFDDSSFDRVFSGDVIEHVDYEDGIRMLKEAYRVLRPGGFLLVHTTPNTIFTKITYPIGKNLLRFINSEAVDAIDDHLGIMGKLHVNEYNLISLNKVAKDAGLGKFDVWLDDDILRSSTHRHTKVFSNNPLVNLLASLGSTLPVKFFFGNDLYLKAYK